MTTIREIAAFASGHPAAAAIIVAASLAAAFMRGVPPAAQRSARGPCCGASRPKTC